MNIIISTIGILGTISSIYFAFLACKNQKIKEEKQESKQEGTMIADIGYIKACVDRVEKNITEIDSRYRSLLERLTRAEENVNHLKKNKGG